MQPELYVFYNSVYSKYTQPLWFWDLEHFKTIKVGRGN